MQMTLQELSPKSFRKLTATASDFHARLSVLLESEEALKIQEELCFLKSCGWLESESLVYFSPKTSEVSSAQGGGRGAKTGLYAVIQRPRGYNKGGMHNEAPTLTGNS